LTMSFAPGAKVGHYEIAAPLGAGGMGEVYRARDTKLGRDVALKVLPDAFARDTQRLARFQREAKLLAALNHPNIASIYGVEDISGTAIIMELVEGPTLADRIRQGPIPVEEALHIAKQICDALEYAHERGIVHRDLKPANVKVTNDGAVKVLDFGLAKAIEEEPASQDISTSPTLSRMVTQAGVLLGTPAYMSPEQAKGKPVDRRTDIWAFGCVLYETLAGKHTFSGETSTDTLASVIKEDPDWTQLPPATPVRVRVVLQRCLQKDPKQRLRDIGDARISLEEVLAGAPEPSSGALVPFDEPLWRRALPWVLFAAAAAALLVLGFLHLRPKPTAVNVVRAQIPVPEKMILSPSGPFALSPDGHQLAFYATGPDGVQGLWIRPLDSVEARPLPGSDWPGVSPPPFFWSPDSQSIMFDGGGNLKKIGISGGQAQTLCEATGFVVGGSWNRDGVILFGKDPGVIARVSANGGSALPVTALDFSGGEIRHTFPWFLPDGHHFLYLRSSNRPENDGVYAGSLDAKPEDQDPKRLLATASQAIYVPSLGSVPGYLLFMRDGALIAQPFDPTRLGLTGEPVTVAEQVGFYRDYGFFSASTNGLLAYRAGGDSGASQLTWFDREGKVVGTLGDRGIYASLAVSSDGKRAAVSRRENSTGKYAIWLYDFSRGTSSRFTFGSASAMNPIWSADESRIFFASDANGRFDLYQKAANGTKDEELLLKSSEAKYPMSVSRDGRFLMYSSEDPKPTSMFHLWRSETFSVRAERVPRVGGPFFSRWTLRCLSLRRIRPFRDLRPDFFTSVRWGTVDYRRQVANFERRRPSAMVEPGRERTVLSHPRRQGDGRPSQHHPSISSRPTPIALPSAATKPPLARDPHSRRQAIFVSGSGRSNRADAFHRRFKLASGAQEIRTAAVTRLQS
jgi:eukaryotic-like serine/threonine-protein kinase